MPQFGRESEANLQQVHPDLVRLMREVIKHWDCKIVDGVRTLAEQKRNVAQGVSQTMNSKHLPQEDNLSHAVDVMPWPIDWAAIEKGLAAVKHADGGLQVLEAYAFQGFVAGMAAAMGISIRQGIDWNRNRDFADQSFHDIPHVELR